MDDFRSVSTELCVRGQPSLVSSPCPHIYTLIYSAPVKLTVQEHLLLLQGSRDQHWDISQGLGFSSIAMRVNELPIIRVTQIKNRSNISLLRKLNNKWRWREDEMISLPNVSPGSELISSDHDRGEDIELRVLSYVIQAYLARLGISDERELRKSPIKASVNLEIDVHGN